MSGIRKRPLILAVAATLVAVPALAEDDTAPDRLDGLLAELSEPDNENWRRVEAEVVRAWSQSGSDAMDLLLERGRAAIAEQDYGAAVEHLTALVDHAPDFAEGWNARATAFYLQGEYGLALADLERTLALNPRHFMALSGVGIILGSMGNGVLALEALQAAEKINPHRDDMRQTIERLERELGGAEL
jgi:tetratricopeptide (TPR) repeat protein